MPIAPGAETFVSYSQYQWVLLLDGTAWTRYNGVGREPTDWSSSVKQSPLSDMGCALLLAGAAGFSSLLLILLAPAREPGERADAASPSAHSAAPWETAHRRPKPKKPKGVPWKDAPALVETALSRVQWEVIFEDDFERDDLGPDWKVGDGTWQLEDGRLLYAAKEEGGANIACVIGQFSGDLRIAYDCQANPTGGRKPSDLSATSDHPPSLPLDPLAGYLYRVGSNFNTHSGISSAQDYTLADNKKAWIIPGKTHHVVIERVDKFFRMTIDGEVVCAGVHPTLYRGPKKSWGGFYVWSGPAWFDNYTLSRPVGETPKYMPPVSASEKPQEKAVRRRD